MFAVGTPDYTPSPSNTSSWLSFLSTFIWQAIIVYLLLKYGYLVRELLSRISKFKFAGVEGEFQTQAPAASPPGVKDSKELRRLDPDTFLTVEEIKEFVRRSGLIEPGENVRDTLLIFDTPNQHTWLIATDKSLFCILDDSDTRKSGKLIQWRQEISTIDTIKAERYKRSQGLLEIGEAWDWLYSVRLHPSPSKLEGTIWQMLKR
jgi:hypothetical protein